ncbi:Crp/Fnr family transcriptional regulator [Pedobacter hiemivivus]|uniref:Crp/Fnr family transcriptional regulator n=1 Tax=Pedobacter hiemivivus TaxID=2530454 RepID=A0A4V2MK79_9SPHI|nr:Crp/Fnr family transcriptional regulator [Pedobacter hiemivivus]TCC97196.1 Crp/Fnr family transcriptional regulator [Pedobacter hiemivivus]
MKQFKKSSLVRKEQISPACYDQITKYFSMVSGDLDSFFPSLKDKLVGYYSSGRNILLRGGAVSDKCWFITEGLVVAYYYDQLNEPVTFAIFEAGEIAMLPDSYTGGQVSECYLMACPDTHLLEINAAVTKIIYELFPETERLGTLILAQQWKKIHQRDGLLRRKGKERVKQFYVAYPGIEGSGRKITLVQKIICSYLIITESSLSRLRKEIKEEKYKYSIKEN